MFSSCQPLEHLHGKGDCPLGGQLIPENPINLEGRSSWSQGDGVLIHSVTRFLPSL